MVISLTAGQICLLELMQQKLCATLKLYVELRMVEKEAAPGSLQQRAVVEELTRLREKIKRISARQKRFTSEIINGNGNNTIPKESYFKALGLVTKETLSQLNSKSNERRRRTTANPRFSHEAIQAKKAALQKPRLEPVQRITRERRGESTRNASAACNTRTNGSSNNTRNNNGKSAQQKTSSHLSEDGTASTTAATRSSQRNGRSGASSRQSLNSDREAALSPLERQILYEKFKLLQQQLENKASTVKDKMQLIKKVEADNLRILDAMDKVQLEAAEDNEEDEPLYRGIKEALERAARNFSSARLLSLHTADGSQTPANDRLKPGLEGLRLKLGEDPSNQGDALMRTIEACFKCEESLDGID